ncbi:hypothetical protein MmiEs2_01020 [Methanimicrococcus stummii]|uniref:Antifreeze protein type I n=1 Tax=Methanimicrococcus stummii TaxID=3028294 RepID=A0AA97A759_9EURY|nr:SPFH domain-containing protein [Methanimicrococcus sp. Es2]WNY27923.1 hypothetical protein MmiEs2_01020 [Methanimicrococcus sp. Es2]
MGIVNVLTFYGTADTFAWKYPNDELSTYTQLIVKETQEAVLYKSGMALDVFGPGRHVLETANIPILNKLINLPFGGKSPFKAEVWYVNKIYSLDIKWGTTSPIQIQDPKYGIFVPVRSFGQFGIKIEDSKKFLTKLVGTLPEYNKTTLTNYFRGLYLTKVKDSISSYLVNKQITLLEINAYLDEISNHLEERIKPFFAEYGIKIVNFYVNDISVPEDDIGVIRLKEALAKRAEMDIIGYNYHTERTFDTLEGAATNPGSSSAGIVGAGLGLGMGIPLGNIMGQQVNNMGQIFNNGETIQCSRCKSPVSKNKQFCQDCGFDMHSSSIIHSVKCSHCGFILDPSKKFCSKCGDKYNPCPNCSADLPENEKVCKSCNYALPEPCPSCNVPVSKESRFCPECGFLLVKKCKSCDADILSDASKFCHKCGSKYELEGGLE